MVRCPSRIPQDLHYVDPVYGEHRSQLPMAHVDELCPFTEGSCWDHCRGLWVHERPCLKTAMTRDRISYELDRGTSPDVILAQQDEERCYARITVGRVMRTRANAAKRMVTAVGKEAHQTGAYQVYCTTLQDFYKKKDKWGYWRRKWDLTWAAEPVVVDADGPAPYEKPSIGV